MSAAVERQRVKKIRITSQQYFQFPSGEVLEVPVGAEIKVLGEVTDLMEPEFVCEDQKFFIVSEPDSVPFVIGLEDNEYEIIEASYIQLAKQ